MEKMLMSRFILIWPWCSQTSLQMASRVMIRSLFFVQFEAGLAGHFHLHLGLLVFSGGGGIGVGFSLLFDVGAGSGETRGYDFGWLLVFLWSGGS